MMKFEVIKGASYTDDRGTLQFVNDFDMGQVKRFYIITHKDITTRRGWRGHQIEQRWFYVTEGAFEIELVKIDDWTKPNPDLKIELYQLRAQNNEVLHVPTGYGTRIRAISENSKVMLFADYGNEHAKLDDHLWPLDYFNNKQ